MTICMFNASISFKYIIMIEVSAYDIDKGFYLDSADQEQSKMTIRNFVFPNKRLQVKLNIRHRSKPKPYLI